MGGSERTKDSGGYSGERISARLSRTGSGDHLTLSSGGPDGNAATVDGVKDETYTVLEQHARFWDRDGDGVITMWDTYRGFREIGFNILMSILSMLIINLNFSYPTRMAYSYIPDPFFRVYIHGMYKAKHGSDSGVYDTEGRFSPHAFNTMFDKWDLNQKGALSGRELWDMLHANRNVMDPYGAFAAVFEFGATWLLVQKDGKVYRDDLKAVYDGTIFYRIRDLRQSGKGWNQGFGLWDFAGFVVRRTTRVLQRILPLAK